MRFNNLPVKFWLLLLKIDCLAGILFLRKSHTEGQEYVEPVHDALVTGWKKILAWKQEQEESLLLQRRLTSAAEEWNSVNSKEQSLDFQSKAEPVIDWLDSRLYTVENLFNKIITQFVRLLRRSQNLQKASGDKPVQFLWNANPYLDVLDRELKYDDNWLNQAETEFVQQSVLQKRKNISWRWRIATAVILGLSGLTITALIGQRNTLIGQVRTSRQSAEANLQSGQELDALLASLRAAKTIKTEWLLQLLKPNAKLQKDVTETLRTMVYTTREINQWKGIQTNSNSKIAFDSQGNLILAQREENGNVTLDNLSNNSQSILKVGREEDQLTIGYYGIAFSKDGKLATTNLMDKITLWNLKREKIKEFSEKFSKSKNGHDLKLLLLSPDSKQLAIVEYTVLGSLRILEIKNLSLWDVSGSKLKQIKPSQDFYHSARGFGFNANNDFVISHLDDKDKVWYLYNFKTGKQLGVLSKDFEFYQGNENFSSELVLVFSPNGDKIANPKVNGVISLWNLKGKLLFEIKNAHQGQVNQIAFTPNGNQLVSTGTDNTVSLWDIREKQLVEVKIKPEQIDRIEFNKNEEYTINEQRIDKFSRSIDVKDKSGNLVFTTPLIKIDPSHKHIQSLSPDGMLLASAYRGMSDGEASISLWNSSGKRIQLLKFNNNYQSSIEEIDFSANGKLLVVKKEDGTVKIWKIEGFDQLMVKGCNLVRDYLNNNPDVEESDKDLCKDIEPSQLSEQTQKISRGEKILVPTLMSPDKQAGVEAISDDKFDTAKKHLEAYRNNTPNDPEALIYLNNAQISNQKSYTIAISAPIGSDVNGALEMLRGVAQAQNEINQAGGINGVLLRVLIADDNNNPDTAKKIAKELVNNPDVLGVVGHYASDVTLATGEVKFDKLGDRAPDLIQLVEITNNGPQSHSGYDHEFMPLP